MKLKKWSGVISIILIALSIVSYYWYGFFGFCIRDSSSVVT